jgi:hypothetical protein
MQVNKNVIVADRSPTTKYLDARFRVCFHDGPAAELLYNRKTESEWFPEDLCISSVFMEDGVWVMPSFNLRKFAMNTALLRAPKSIFSNDGNWSTWMQKRGQKTPSDGLRRQQGFPGTCQGVLPIRNLSDIMLRGELGSGMREVWVTFLKGIEDPEIRKWLVDEETYIAQCLPRCADGVHGTVPITQERSNPRPVPVDSHTTTTTAIQPEHPADAPRTAAPSPLPTPTATQEPPEATPSPLPPPVPTDDDAVQVQVQQTSSPNAGFTDLTRILPGHYVSASGGFIPGVMLQASSDGLLDRFGWRRIEVVTTPDHCTVAACSDTDASQRVMVTQRSGGPACGVERDVAMGMTFIALHREVDVAIAKRLAEGVEADERAKRAGKQRERDAQTEAAEAEDAEMRRRKKREREAQAEATEAEDVEMRKRQKREHEAQLERFETEQRVRVAQLERFETDRREREAQAEVDEVEIRGQRKRERECEAEQTAADEREEVRKRQCARRTALEEARQQRLLEREQAAHAITIAKLGAALPGAVAARAASLTRMEGVATKAVKQWQQCGTEVGLQRDMFGERFPMLDASRFLEAPPRADAPKAQASVKGGVDWEAEVRSFVATTTMKSHQTTTFAVALAVVDSQSQAGPPSPGETTLWARLQRLNALLEGTSHLRPGTARMRGCGVTKPAGVGGRALLKVHPWLIPVDTVPALRAELLGECPSELQPFGSRIPQLLPAALSHVSAENHSTAVHARGLIGRMRPILSIVPITSLLRAMGLGSEVDEDGAVLVGPNGRLVKAEAEPVIPRLGCELARVYRTRYEQDPPRQRVGGPFTYSAAHLPWMWETAVALCGRSAAGALRVDVYTQLLLV